MKQLDFIIIGAQKSATTSLFKYLVQHPSIYMPADKEAPFFSDDRLYEAGWEQFTESYFKDAGEDKLWGTASPQYMGDPRAAERIYKHSPQARLIAILRDPIERAYSHFNMTVRRDMEKRDFDTVVSESLTREHLDRYRHEVPPDHHQGYNADNNEDTHFYFVWSEYGRILNHYLEFFPPEQLLILYMDDLMSDPRQTLKRITGFLGLEEPFEPDNLGKVYHKGGNSVIIPNAWKEKLKNNPAFRLVWDRVPSRTRGYMNYWYEQLNVVKRKDAGPSRKARQQLIEHFSGDIRLLEKLSNRQVPWQEYHT